MPPKANSVDGISKPAGPPIPIPPPSGRKPNDIKPLEDRLKPATNRAVKSSPRVSSGTAIPIIVTLIVMVLLIGLAYFAYNKNK